MNPINQTIEDRTGDYESKSLSLEEMDVLCRKCHQLHDEEIILIIGRFFRVMKKFFSAERNGITTHRQINGSSKLSVSAVKN
ncbi:hypothetical protein [Desulfocastanea catecholica]